MNGQIEIELRGRKVMVLGGPYRDKPAGIAGVKLAREITASCDVRLDIADFSVPTVSDALRALTETFDILQEDGAVYVGCMGGIGRTGMFMALIAMVAAERNNRHPQKRNWFMRLWSLISGGGAYHEESDENKYMRTDPMGYIRDKYHPHAVETQGQVYFINYFPITAALELVFNY